MKDLVYLHKVLALPKPEEGWKTLLKLDSLIVQLHINLLDFKIALQGKGAGDFGNNDQLAIAAQQFLSLGDDHIHTYQHLARTIKKR